MIHKRRPQIAVPTNGSEKPHGKSGAQLGLTVADQTKMREARVIGETVRQQLSADPLSATRWRVVARLESDRTAVPVR